MISVVRAMAARRRNYAATVLADSPLAYWRLDEASGNFVDSSGNARTATKAGTVTYGAASLLPSDPHNKAISMAGAGSANGAGNVNPTAITLEAWIRFTSLTSVPCVMYRDTGVAGNRIFQFRVEAAGELKFTFWTSGGGPFQAVTATGLILVNTTYHVVATYDNANAKVYINNTLSQTLAQTGNLASGTTPYYFGGTFSSDHYVSGSVDEIAVYPTALTAARIDAHYKAA